MIRTEHNARIHAMATLLAVLCAWGFEIDRGEWIAVILSIAFVWTAEAFNTAIESLCDAISQKPNPRIKTAKDVAAGAVLLSAIAAFAVGALIFGPRVLSLLSH